MDFIGVRMGAANDLPKRAAPSEVFKPLCYLSYN